MTEALHRLPNGDWITLEDVREIEAYDERNDGTPAIECHVTTVLANDVVCETFLDFPSLEEAVAYCDTLAQIVNTARQNPRR